MKITSLDLPKDYAGLSNIHMAGLGDLVILAGRNGSGKTRLLRAIENFGQKKLTPDAKFQRNQQIESLRANASHFTQQLIQAEKLPQDTPNREPQIQSLKNNIESTMQQIGAIEQQIADAQILTTENDVAPKVVYYRVQKDRIRDWKSVNQNEIATLASNLGNEFNVALVTEAGIAAVHDLINSYVYASNPETTGTERQQELKVKIENLRHLLRQFLGTELTWDDRGDPHIFGRPMAGASLSEGQGVLLQIALSLFFQDGTQEELVLLLDEPENHLHPLALIQLVDEVRRTCRHAQIWIATHSVSLIAHYDPSALWLVHDGEVTRAGSKSIEVLDALLGHETGVEELSTLLALPARQTAVHFASQCLVPPLAADTAIGDPQTRQIAAILHMLATSEKPLRILDFGAGVGRLAMELEPTLRERSLDYWAWDVKDAQTSTQCRARLERIFEGGDQYLEGDESLAALYGTVDVVVMCNSLHEVPPAEWPKLFGPHGLVTELISPGGHLLIVEDQLLSFGERAHDSGFHVLDEMQLRKLFRLSETDARLKSIAHSDPRYTDRLKAHLVSGDALQGASTDTVSAALLSLKEHSLRAIRNLLRLEQSHKAGRRLAFWMHQHVNAILALEAE